MQLTTENYIDNKREKTVFMFFLSVLFYVSLELIIFKTYNTRALKNYLKLKGFLKQNLP